MRSRSFTAVVIALVLAFSVVLPSLVVQGQTPDYPIVVTVDGETVFVASHSSSLAEGNWVELIGGSSVALPVLSLTYEGPPSAVYHPQPGVTVSIASPFTTSSATYPLNNHQIYSTSQSISATFWGASALVGTWVNFKLISISSLAEARQIAVETYNGNIDFLRDKLICPTWSETLNPSGDATVTIPPQSIGSYLLVVTREDGQDIYVYSATIVEVVKQTLDVSCPSSVEKGDNLNIDTGLNGLNIHGAVMIKESAYTGEVKLVSGGTVPTIAIYLNGQEFVDGSFIIDNEDLSIEDMVFLFDKISSIFGSSKLAYAVTAFTGSMSISTDYLTTGDYVLLVGVYDPIGSKLLGVYQKTVTVRPEPPPSPGVSNKPPVADAGPDQTVYIDETVNFDGSGSYDPDGSIMSWKWKFGDGETASGYTASHTYLEPSIYTVTLTVRDWRNAEDSDTCIVKVRETSPPPPPLPPPPLPPILSNLTITPEEIELGGYITIRLLIENIDSQSITYIVTMKIEDIPLMVYVELEAYESTLVSHTLIPETVGNYTVTADGLTASFTVKPPTIPPRPAEFIISDITVFPNEVSEGESVIVTVNVTNIGEIKGNHMVVLKLDGIAEEMAEITLIGGASTTITFTLTEAAGGYTVEIEGLTGIFTVSAIPVTVPSLIKTEYIAGILILLIAIGVYIYIRYSGESIIVTKINPEPEKNP